MSLLGDSLAAVGDALRAVAGDTVTYTPAATGVDKSIAGTWQDRGTGQEEMEDGLCEVQRGTLSNVAANDTDGVAAPVKGDTVTVGGVKFAVWSFEKRAGTWLLTVNRAAAQRKGGKRIRRF